MREGAGTVIENTHMLYTLSYLLLYTKINKKIAERKEKQRNVMSVITYALIRLSGIVDEEVTEQLFPIDPFPIK